MKLQEYLSALQSFESIDMNNLRCRKWILYLRMSECCINQFNKEKYEKEKNIYKKKIYEKNHQSYYIFQK